MFFSNTYLILRIMFEHRQCIEYPDCGDYLLIYHSVFAMSFHGIMQFGVIWKYILTYSWDYYTETDHFPANRIIELFETHGPSRAIVIQIKLYRHSKSSGASSLCWLGRSRGEHGNCRCHSAIKWSARWEPASQFPQISEHAPFDLYSETHYNTFSWP